MAVIIVNQLFHEVGVLDLLEVLLWQGWLCRLAQDCLQRGNTATAEEATGAGVYTDCLGVVRDAHQSASAVVLFVLHNGHHARPDVLDEAGVVGMICTALAKTLGHSLRKWRHKPLSTKYMLYRCSCSGTSSTRYSLPKHL